jgi:hypothetical protein
MAKTYKIKAKVKCTIFYDGKIFNVGDDFICDEISNKKLKTLREFLTIEKEE